MQCARYSLRRLRRSRSFARLIERRSENSRKARLQLLRTIEEFICKIDFTNKRLEAYVVVGLEFTETPAKKAQDLVSTLEFESLGVTLFHDGNEKKFK